MRRSRSSLGELPWITVIDVLSPGSSEQLTVTLDEGEAEAILLAQHLDAPVLMDEKRGRKVAEGLGLRVTGTLGVLIAAKRHGRISSVTASLDALEEDGFFVSRSLRELTLEAADERPATSE